MYTSSDDWRRLLIERRTALLRRWLRNGADEREVLEQDALEPAERASEQMIARVLDSLGERELQQLQEISEAIVRVDAERFGNCVRCGEPIAIERLRARPESAFCSDCAEERDMVRDPWKRMQRVARG
jgi:RNA polymerase-binding transcription factor DksA